MEIGGKIPRGHPRQGTDLQVAHHKCREQGHRCHEAPVSHVSLDNKLPMFKMLVRPTRLYASPAWGMAAKTHISKLQTVQNKYLRMAFDAPWYIRGNQLHREAGMPTIEEVMLQTAQKAFAKAET